MKAVGGVLVGVLVILCLGLVACDRWYTGLAGEYLAQQITPEIMRALGHNDCMRGINWDGCEPPRDEPKPRLRVHRMNTIDWMGRP